MINGTIAGTSKHVSSSRVNRVEPLTQAETHETQTTLHLTNKLGTRYTRHKPTTSACNSHEAAISEDDYRQCNAANNP